jgi:hypothetical protein
MSTDRSKVDLSSLLGDTLLVHKDGKMVEFPTSSLNGKTVGIYFSAHWYAVCAQSHTRFCAMPDSATQETRRIKTLLFFNKRPDHPVI